MSNSIKIKRIDQDGNMIDEEVSETDVTIGPAYQERILASRWDDLVQANQDLSDQVAALNDAVSTMKSNQMKIAEATKVDIDVVPDVNVKPTPIDPHKPSKV
jgi:hypothetical protein